MNDTNRDPSELESRYELYEDRADEWRWRLKAPNGEIIADSSEGYKTRGGCQLAISRMQWMASTSNVRDITLSSDERETRRLERAREKFRDLINRRPGGGDGDE